MADITDAIDQKIGEVRIKELDISFSELMSLHEEDELIISPEYQRLFRWTPGQCSRLIESILVELPIPQFFVVENDNGVLELVDGLQRISSVFRFINPSLLDRDQPPDPLELTDCDLVPELNGKTFNCLPLRLRLHIKRATVRMVMIRRQSSYRLRFEMFKRLNTGGSLLTSQEIRNCSARMVGDAGIKFYAFIKECVFFSSFATCITRLSETEKEQKMDEELVLRFFALKNAQNLFAGSISEWLDKYMDSVILGKIKFDYAYERKSFEAVFSLLETSMKEEAFVRFREDKPIGGPAPAYFESVTIGTLRVIDRIGSISPDRIRSKLIEIRQQKAFRDNIGSGANTQEKMEGRIAVVENGLLELLES